MPYDCLCFSVATLCIKDSSLYVLSREEPPDVGCAVFQVDETDAEP